MNIKIALVASLVVVLSLITSANKTENFVSTLGIAGIMTIAYLIAACVQSIFDKIGLMRKILPFLSVPIIGSVLTMVLAHIFGAIAGVSDSRRPPERIFQSIVITVFLSLITIPFTALYYYAPNLLRSAKTIFGK